MKVDHCIYDLSATSWGFPCLCLARPRRSQEAHQSKPWPPTTCVCFLGTPTCLMDLVYGMWMVILNGFLGDSRGVTADICYSLWGNCGGATCWFLRRVHFPEKDSLLLVLSGQQFILSVLQPVLIGLDRLDIFRSARFSLVFSLVQKPNSDGSSWERASPPCAVHLQLHLTDLLIDLVTNCGHRWQPGGMRSWRRCSNWIPGHAWMAENHWKTWKTMFSLCDGFPKQLFASRSTAVFKSLPVMPCASTIRGWHGHKPRCGRKLRCTKMQYEKNMVHTQMCACSFNNIVISKMGRVYESQSHQSPNCPSLLGMARKELPEDTSFITGLSCGRRGISEILPSWRGSEHRTEDNSLSRNQEMPGMLTSWQQCIGLFGKIETGKPQISRENRWFQSIDGILVDPSLATKAYQGTN